MNINFKESLNCRMSYWAYLQYTVIFLIEAVMLNGLQFRGFYWFPVLVSFTFRIASKSLA